MSRPVSSSMTLSASSRGRVRILYTCGVIFGPMHVGYMSSRSESHDVRQAFNVHDLEMRPLVITGGKIQKVERAFYLVAGRIAEYKISVDWREFIGLRKKVQDYLHCSMENVEYFSRSLISLDASVEESLSGFGPHAGCLFSLGVACIWNVHVRTWFWTFMDISWVDYSFLRRVSYQGWNVDRKGILWMGLT
jgi:hypothetical protein